MSELIDAVAASLATCDGVVWGKSIPGCATPQQKNRYRLRAKAALDVVALRFERDGRQYGRWNNGEIADEIRGLL